MGSSTGVDASAANVPGEEGESSEAKPSESQPEESEAGEAPTDAGSAEATSDAGDASPEASAGDASAPTADATVPTGPATPTAPKPATIRIDGLRGAGCFDDADCKGDDLLCFLPAGLRAGSPGFCTDDCKVDTDCQAIAGMATTCGDGQCRVDCSGAKGMGDGACPSNMACLNTAAPPTSLVFPAWHCVYPEGSGVKTAQAFEKCALAHGSGDCADDLLCVTARSGAASSPDDERASAVSLPHCTAACKVASDCKSPTGITAAAACDLGACQLDCAAGGSTCPTGMSCRDVGTAFTESFRCVLLPG
jgi:hypothetical protein